VATRFDEARREARAADERRAREPVERLPPLLGVPLTVKECFALTGMPHTSGLVARRRVRATEDAPVVARMRAAGAIALGVTNTSELCMWLESNNYVYGRTSNPYDSTRIAGGSSGGEAAIIGAGASPIGIGSDIGGSIRNPAFFNGIFGHKPTGGLVPGTGQYPSPSAAAARYLTTGPMARRASDLMPLLRIMAGPDGVDPGCTARALRDVDAVDLRGLRVLDVADDGKLGVSAELRHAQEEAARALKAAGAHVETASFPALAHQFEIWSAMLGAAQTVPFGTMLGEGTPIAPAREILRWALGRSDHTLMASLLALVDPLTHALPRLTARYLAMGKALQQELTRALGPDGVMLYPPYSTVAPRHDEPVRDALRLRFPAGYCGIMNVLELPSTAVPLGLNRDGVPLGVQVVGAHGRDDLTIRVAMELERAFGGWVEPGSRVAA
jgi:fatty acid amide hydrolase 2